MKRDWISTGRRPTGLCGAALLLAARAFNINRTVTDIVQVVHISHSVVRKRLDEFANTPSGSLTINEFSCVDLVSKSHFSIWHLVNYTIIFLRKRMKTPLHFENLRKKYWKHKNESKRRKRRKLPRRQVARYIRCLTHWYLPWVNFKAQTNNFLPIATIYLH